MAERYTRRDAEGALKRLAEHVGRPYSPPEQSEPDVPPGGLFLTSHWGGYTIDAKGWDGRGVERPYGHDVRSAREIYDLVYFAQRVAMDIRANRVEGRIA